MLMGYRYAFASFLMPGIPSYRGPDKESNWLPTPAGAFRPTLRLYQPQEAAFDGSWQPPAVKRIG
jgi:hypothetical protein